MSIIVQKFGGTSVADTERIKKVAERVVRTRRAGYDVVMVVSARGKTTDELYTLAYEITDSPAKRELDMLVSTGEQISAALVAMAVNALGEKAISFLAHQVHIHTDSAHQSARIRKVDCERIVAALEERNVVIVAGFQGIDEKGNITTLGRGGSDTTAVALAAALEAEVCEIYTDVDGVYTTDPRIVPEAKKVDSLSYDEMLELASLGAGVLHNRSVEFAKRYAVPIHVRSSFSEEEGTRIIEEVKKMEDILVRAAALAKDEAKLTIRGVPDKPGIAAKICHSLAEKNINIDMIVQNTSSDNLTDFSFTVSKADLDDASRVTEEIRKEIGAKSVQADEKIAKLSVVGVGMRSHVGVAEKMFSALAEKKINIQMISTSEIKISVVIDEERAEEALRAVHKAFELDK